MPWDIAKWIIFVLLIVIGVIVKEHIEDRTMLYNFGFMIGVFVGAIVNI